MNRHPILFRTFPLVADLIIFVMLAAIIYGLTTFGAQWQASYNPSYEIDLGLGSLPLYALFSSLRGIVAYMISLLFTLSVGYWAAKSPRAEKFILPFLDVMQSIPVLGFLPGLVLGLVAIFPRTNTGLELSCVLMIFTGQVWNMAFAFYSSLKSVPIDLQEATAVMKLTAAQRFRLLELPFSAMNLTWNSVMSMAGGWFFLTVCEAFTLGDRDYRLPGLGAYMAVAVEHNDTRATIAGIVAMAMVIIIFDALFWKPALAWAHGFRLEETENEFSEQPLIGLLIRDSGLFRFFKKRQRRRAALSFYTRAKERLHKAPPWVLKTYSIISDFKISEKQMHVLVMIASIAGIGLSGYGCLRLFNVLSQVSLPEWGTILQDTGFTAARVLVAVAIGTLWATPMGIWIAQSPQRLKVAQPIIQLLASFPAPMLYPLAMAVFIFLHINFEISSMLLMLLGVQWYVLFNVLAGALRIPTELRLALRLMKSARFVEWRYLYLPSVFPSLVTGWVTAAGGAWNASIVSELITYKGHKLLAHGLGADISEAAEHANFPRLAACLFVMVIVVVVLNRTLWAKIYRVAQTRYRLDL